MIEMAMYRVSPSWDGYLRGFSSTCGGLLVFAVLVVVSGVFGIWEHIESNYDAGELDQVYSARWETLPAASRWWLAVSKTVGPSPPLAPGALAQAGLCVLLATVRHPARRPAA